MKDKDKEKCQFDGCDKNAGFLINKLSSIDNEDHYGVFCADHYKELAIQETEE